MAAALGLYLLGFALIFIPGLRWIGVALILAILLLHLAELKTALRIGRARRLTDGAICRMDLLFGFTWWLPLKRNIF
jgi:hypothetical protein